MIAVVNFAGLMTVNNVKIVEVCGWVNLVACVESRVVYTDVDNEHMTYL